MEIRKLTNEDISPFTELIQVFEGVFEMENFVLPSKEHLLKLLSTPGFMVFVAMENTSVLGGLTVYTLPQYYSEKPQAYLYDLAIRTDYQRKGIGKQLIAGLNSYCLHNGYQEVFVQADKTDDYALDFYRCTNPTNEEQVVHFSYILE